MTSPDQLPRVVVLCDEPINKVSGGGVTMGNLFRGWPKDRLGQVWAHHRFEIDTDVCSHYLRLGDHKMPGHSWVPQEVRRMRRLVKWLRTLIRPGIRLNYEQVLSWVREFDPDLIYAQPTAYPMYTWWLPRWLSRDLRIPLVNHIMDDWPTELEEDWWPIYKQVMTPVLRYQLRALFSMAFSNLAICQRMADVFSERYSTEFHPFHNTIDFEEWTEPKEDYSVQGEVFRIVYLGALAERRQVGSLRDVARLVSTLVEEGAKVSLTVHTGEMYKDIYLRHLDGLTGVSHGGRVARQDLCACLAAADLLLLPVDFAVQGAGVGRYSMPTKVPEYMASATPVLVYGPSYVPAADYAHTEGWGYVIGQRDSDVLKKALLELMGLEELRARLGKRGRELAMQNHDARSVRRNFRVLLRDASESGRLEKQG
jgi:glycosyltransferase involved in cell wall biosynthesis